MCSVSDVHINCTSGLHGTTHNILLHLLYVIHKKSEFSRLQITFLMSYTETLNLQTPDYDPLRIEV